MSDQTQWLIRTARNWIAGPYPTEEVQKMILEGRLAIEDEVCPSQGYWTFLHERHEILKLLGIEVPRTVSAEDDVTETQILPSDKTGSVHGVVDVTASSMAPSLVSVQKGNAAIPPPLGTEDGEPERSKVLQSQVPPSLPLTVEEEHQPIPFEVPGGQFSPSSIQHSPRASHTQPPVQAKSTFVQKVHVVGNQEQFSIARGIFWLLLGLGFILLVAFVVNALKI